MQENYPTLVSIKKLKQEFDNLKAICITNEEFSIGRCLDNTVVIAYLAISRRHCVLKKISEEEWGIEDFSSFGIQVNKRQLKRGELHKLNHNDIIQLDATGDFIYKFVVPDNDDCFPRKRMKLEGDVCSSKDMIENVKIKFEESQHFEIKHIEEKIMNAKQMQNTSKILKQQLELDMARKIQHLETSFASQIENLKGEKIEIEKQKAILEEQRDLQLSSVKAEMEEKITDLMDQIKKHNETESELLTENTALKEKLLKEREEFLAELHRESSSKQVLLTQLEAKMKEQEEIRLKEKQDLELVLKAETEQLRLAKEKELKELEEQKKIREKELEQELSKIKSDLEQQMSRTESERSRLEQELRDKTEEMEKVSNEEKTKVEQLLKERQESEKKLAEAEAIASKSLEELKERVSSREAELSALAAQQADHSRGLVAALQLQLDSVRSELETVEVERNVLIESACLEPGAKQAALAEVGELMESELQCSICAELFVSATTLGCSHTYCKYCITVWRKRKSECPICRAPITSECKSLVLDSFIEKMVANLTDEMKQKRQAMLRDREELDAELARKNSEARRGSDGDDYSGSEDGSSEGLEEEEEYDRYPRYYRRRYYDTDSGSDSLADSQSSGDASALSASSGGGAEVPGAAGAYYGGYGRCFRCGARGHWAPGCPRD